MSTGTARRTTLTLACSVLVPLHLAVAALAVLELTRLDWITGFWFDLMSVTLIVTTATIGLVAALFIGLRAYQSRRMLRLLLRTHLVPGPEPLRQAADELGIASDLDVVASDELLALTHGLRRPRILLSTGLLDALSQPELAAVLAHERCHLRGRDPRRLLLTRMLSAYACYLPSAAHAANRAALRLELAADRAALAHADRTSVAAALLKLADTSTHRSVLATSPAMSRRGRDGWLRARIEQLEGEQPRRRVRRWLTPFRMAATTGNVAVLAAAAMCCVGMSQTLPGGIV